MLGTNYSVEDVFFDEDFIFLKFSDGRIMAVPRIWFPMVATEDQHSLLNFTISPFGVHWPELDEHISVSGLLNGRGAQCIPPEVHASLSYVRRIFETNTD